MTSGGPPALRKAYPSDVSDDEWAFVAPYLALLPEDAGQRTHSLREVYNGLRWLVRTGSAWRYLPHDLPPWEAVYQQTQRWLKAAVFEQIAHDLREIVRQLADRAAQPSAVILDGRTIQSTPERGAAGRAGFDGAKKTGPRRRRAARFISRSIRWATCWRWWSRRQTSKSVPKLPS